MIQISPYLPLSIILTFTLVSLFLCLFPKRNLWAALFQILLCIVLLNPEQQIEEKESLPEKVAIVIDKSRSNSAESLQQITTQVADRLMQELNSKNIQVERRTFTDNTATGSTPFQDHKDLFFNKNSDLSGVVLISDGQLHNVPQHIETPLFFLQTESENSYDPVLKVTKAPEFAIVKEKAEISLIIEDTKRKTAPLFISIAGNQVINQNIQTNTIVTFNLTLPQAGPMSLHISTPEVANERTADNNKKTLLIKGIRDNLNVLLVSGIPHNGTQTLRRLLKSDPSVNMIHFTILRDFNSENPVAEEDLSLIPFPVRELFMKRLFDFDLVIFDHYINRGLLSMPYLQNIKRYTASGGALLFVTGNEFTQGQGLGRSLLNQLMPIRVGYESIHNAFQAQLSPLGKEHPVTAPFAQTLQNWSPLGQLSTATAHKDADVLMRAGNDPLLVLGGFEQGRVAMFLSDHLWLWGRNVNSGGNMQELVRRISHWLMKEPELEKNRFILSNTDTNTLNVAFNGHLKEDIDVSITRPDLTTTSLKLKKANNWQASMPLENQGLYIAKYTPKNAKAIYGYYQHGQVNDLEWQPSSGYSIHQLAQESGGGQMYLHTLKAPEQLKLNISHKNAIGQGWINLKPKANYKIIQTYRKSLYPMGAALVLLLALAAIMWVKRR